MNEKEARKHINDLKGFYGHLMSFIVVMIGLVVTNVFTFLRGDPAIWVVMPFMFWGGFVFLHGWGVMRYPHGRRWEEEKFRELTGWSASGEELANLADRVDILLTILNSAQGGAGIDVEEARRTLKDVKRTIEYYQAPLDKDVDDTLEKDKVIHMVEKLEALVTSREFRQRDPDLSSNP